MVTHTRQQRDNHIERITFVFALFIHRVFRIQGQAMEIGQHSEHRFAGAFFQPVQASLQQGNIAPETVDHKTQGALLFAFRQKIQRTGEVRKDTAAINVRHQDYRAIHHFGKAHIGNVVIAQIDFRRAARAFGDDHIKPGRQILPGRQHRLPGGFLVGVVIQRLHIAQHLAANNDLRAHVGLRLEQHRVHVTVWLHPAGQCLQRSRSADLAPIHGHRTVQCHVLRLERRHRITAPGKPPTQRRHHRALSRIGGAALHH